MRIDRWYRSFGGGRALFPALKIGDPGAQGGIFGAIPKIRNMRKAPGAKPARFSKKDQQHSSVDTVRHCICPASTRDGILTIYAPLKNREIYLFLYLFFSPEGNGLGCSRHFLSFEARSQYPPARVRYTPSPQASRGSTPETPPATASGGPPNGA